MDWGWYSPSRERPGARQEQRGRRWRRSTLSLQRTGRHFTVMPRSSICRKIFLPWVLRAMDISLYGAWKVKDLGQLAIFPVKDGKAAAVPSTVVLLPRGIESAVPSPQGTRFAIAADPRPRDPGDNVRHVLEPAEVSLHVVNADGTGGQWWCRGLNFISTIGVGGGPNAPAWSADGESLALLSQLPRLGHHDVSTANRCVQRRGRAACDGRSKYGERNCVGGRGTGDCVSLDKVRCVDGGARLDGPGRGWRGAGSHVKAGLYGSAVGWRCSRPCVGECESWSPE